MFLRFVPVSESWGGDVYLSSPGFRSRSFSGSWLLYILDVFSNGLIVSSLIRGKYEVV